MKAQFDYTKVNNILSALERMPLMPVDCQDSDSPAAPMGAALRVIGEAALSQGHYGCVVRIDSGSVLKLAVGERDGYPAYIEWAARNPQPHVPRVLAHGWIGPMFWCVLPRYFELNGEDSDRINHMSEKATFIKTREAIKARFSNFRWDLHAANIMFDRELGEYVITDPLANVKGDEQSRDCIMYRTLGVEQLTTQAEIDFDADPQPTSMPDFQHRVFRGNPQQIRKRNIGPDDGSGCELGDDWGDTDCDAIDWSQISTDVVAVAWDCASPGNSPGSQCQCSTVLRIAILQNDKDSPPRGRAISPRLSDYSAAPSVGWALGSRADSRRVTSTSNSSTPAPSPAMTLALRLPSTSYTASTVPSTVRRVSARPASRVTT